MNPPKSNLHTHTTFCDGKNTPEELVQEALRQKMQSLGFSGHSHTDFDTAWCMSKDGTVAYRNQIAALKTQYRDRIRLFCGIEQDFYASQPAKDFDYVIGSVHYLLVNGKYIQVDESLSILQKAVDEDFSGNVYQMLRCYFETVAQLPQQTHCDIIGHFDLVEKFNAENQFFSPDDYRYRRPLLDALDSLLAKDVIFEINTGAVSRGYRRLPYPSSYCLRRIAEKRGRVIINSDAHKAMHLMYGFSDAVQYARSCGVGGLTILGEFGWETLPIGAFLKN